MQHRFDLRVVRELARHVIDEQFDLLHAHTPRSALSPRRLPATHVAHGFIMSIALPRATARAA
jgi:hypothetical protein